MEPIRWPLGEARAGNEVSYFCQLPGIRWTESQFNIEKPADDFQDVKVIAFPATKEKTVLSSGKVVFPKTSGDATVVDFLATEDFTLRSIRIYPSTKAIQTNAYLSVKDGNEYRELAKFQISRFNAALNVGFEPYAPVVVSVPATVGRNFRLELDQKVESYELEI